MSGPLFDPLATLRQTFFHPLPQRRLILPLVMILTVMAGGTLGYQWIENWSMEDALWMTMITVTTTGYGEVHPLSANGRLFTMGLLIVSISVAGYAITQLTAFVVEGELNQLFAAQRMDRRITTLKDHFIICGGGHVGYHIAEEFMRLKVPFVVIETNLDAVQRLEQLGNVPYLKASPAQNETLKQAQIADARGLVTTLDSDKDNIFIVLSARALNSQLQIISRVMDDENQDKLRLAGANSIISTDEIGGQHIAALMARPTLASFVNELIHASDDAVRLDEVATADARKLIGRALGEIKTDALILGIRRANGSTIYHPDQDTRIEAGDVLMVLGSEKQRKALSR